MLRLSNKACSKGCTLRLKQPFPTSALQHVLHSARELGCGVASTDRRPSKATELLSERRLELRSYLVLMITYKQKGNSSHASPYVPPVNPPTHPPLPCPCTFFFAPADQHGLSRPFVRSKNHTGSFSGSTSGIVCRGRPHRAGLKTRDPSRH